MKYIRDDYGNKMAYKIDKHGNVFNEKGVLVKIHIKNTRIYKGSIKPTKPRPYVYVHDRNGKSHGNQLGRWLLLTYRPIKNAKTYQVNHIDGNPMNNDLDNLEWVTRRDNMKHAADNNLLPYGENHHNSKYSDKLIHSICQDIIDGISTTDIQKKYNVNNQLVNDIKSGRSHKKISKTYVKKGFVYTKYDKLSDIKVANEICSLIEQGYSNSEISKKLNLSNTCLPNDIRKKRVYKYVSKNYKI